MAPNPDDTAEGKTTSRQRSRPIDELRNQWPTAAVCTLVALLVGLLAVLDVVHLADAIALEGVVVAVLFGVVALAAATEHKNSLVEVSATMGTVVGTARRHEEELGVVAADIGGVAANIGGVADDIKSVTRDLNAVSKTILTRPVPDDEQLLRITQLVGKSGSWRAGAAPKLGAPTLRVLCDNPAFSIFSEGPAFDAYFAALKGQLAGCVSEPPTRRVELMFLGAKERRELHADQVRRYANDASWQGWRDVPERLVKLTKFWERTARICGLRGDDAVLPAQLTRDAYIKRLELVNADIRERHLTGALIYDLEFPGSASGTLARKHGPTVYFWMRDEGIPLEEEAIFSIVPLGDVEATRASTRSRRATPTSSRRSWASSSATGRRGRRSVSEWARPARLTALPEASRAASRTPAR